MPSGEGKHAVGQAFMSRKWRNFGGIFEGEGKEFAGTEKHARLGMLESDGKGRTHDQGALFRQRRAHRNKRKIPLQLGFLCGGRSFRGTDAFQRGGIRHPPGLVLPGHGPCKLG